MKDCSAFIFRVKQSQKSSCVGRSSCSDVGLHLNCYLYCELPACFTHPCQYIKAQPRFCFYQPHCPDWYNIPTCPHMASILGQPHPEDDGSTILQNIGYYFPKNSATSQKTSIFCGVMSSQSSSMV